MRHVLACLVAAMLLAACTSPEATPTPSARPSGSTATSVTPTPSLTPSPSMTMGYRVEDVQAAEAVYREVRKGLWELGAKNEWQLSSSLRALLTPNMQSLIEQVMKNEVSQGYKFKDGQGEFIWMRPIEEAGGSRGSVRLEVCVDQRDIRYLDPKGRLVRARVIHDRVSFEKQSDGSLRLAGNKSVGDGEECLE